MKPEEKKDSKNYQKRVKNLREKLGMTQRQFAKEFGVSHSIVALWEIGSRNPSGTAIKLIEIYEQKTRAK